MDKPTSHLTWLRAFAGVLLSTMVTGALTTAQAQEKKTVDKVVTYQVESNKNNTKDAKAYAVFAINIAPGQIDTTKTKGALLKDVRLEPRYADPATKRNLLGTLIIFENDKKGIAPGKRDDIQIHFQNLPKSMKEIRFSDVSTLRSGVGRDGNVIEENVGRIGFKVEMPGQQGQNGPPGATDTRRDYSILNAAGQSPFAVRDLQYLLDVPEIVDTGPVLDFTNSYGFTPLSPGSTLVDLLSSPAIPISGEVNLDRWFYVRGIATIDGLDVPFVHGQNEGATGATAVPEPVSLALAATGLAGLTAYAWRRRRRGR